MKTVQEWLRKLDTDQLIDAYLDLEPISKDRMEKNGNLSVQELLQFMRNRLSNYIERLRTIPITVSDDPHILFVYEVPDDIGTKNEYDLVHLSDLYNKGLDAPSYAYEFSPQSEIVGFFVADNRRTQDDIYGLMADVMYEASFFGFEQEGLAAEKEELDRRIEEIESGNFVGIPAKEVWKGLGIEEEEESEEEMRLESSFYDAKLKYGHFLQRKALQEVIDVLIEEGMIENRKK